MTQEKIDRINALYRKSQAEGLTEEEKKEQALLRKEFVASVKNNLRSQLNNIDMVNEDGSVENLGEKYGKQSPTSEADQGDKKFTHRKRTYYLQSSDFGAIAKTALV